MWEAPYHRDVRKRWKYRGRETGRDSQTQPHAMKFTQNLAEMTSFLEAVEGTLWLITFWKVLDGAADHTAQAGVS